MDHYNRAFRDPKSPLAPLTPLSRSGAFNFNFGGDNSLSQCINAVKSHMQDGAQRSGVKRYSEKFIQLRDVFENLHRTQPQIKVGEEKPLKTNKAPNLDTSNNPNIRAPKIDIPKASSPKANTTKIETVKVRSPKTSAAGINSSNVHATKYVNPMDVAAGNDRTPKKKSFFSMPTYEQAAKTAQLLLEVPKLVSRSRTFLQKSPERKQQRQASAVFRQTSPVPPKPLSPRIASLLTKTGMSQYLEVFQREEIDMDVFRLLDYMDLELFGVKNEDKERLMEAIRLACEIYSKPF